MGCECGKCRTESVVRPRGALTGIQRNAAESYRESLPLGLANREERSFAVHMDEEGCARIRPCSTWEQAESIRIRRQFEWRVGLAEE